MTDQAAPGPADANADLERTARADFRATSDPALQSGPGAELFAPRELFLLWERQGWQTQAIDFAQDGVDWHGMPEEERVQRMYGLSTFFVGEQRVAAALAPLIHAIDDEDARMFLCTQIADEARHVAFFDRFYAEAGILPTGSLGERLAATSRHLKAQFTTLFDDMLAVRGRRLWQEPGDLEALVEFVTIYHLVIEGMLGLTGQHFIIGYNERAGTLPGFVEGLTNVARDEHRHVAFGVWLLRDMVRRDGAHAATIQRVLGEAAPAADDVLRPSWMDDMSEADVALFGVGGQNARAFAAQALARRLKVITGSAAPA